MDQNLYRTLFWLRQEKALLVLAALALLAVEAHRLVVRPRQASFGAHAGRSTTIRTPLPEVPPFFRQWRQRFLAENQSTDSLGLVNAVFLGESARLTSATRESFVNAGLAHLLTTNGLKAWVVAVAFGIFGNIWLSFCSTFFNGLQNLRLRKWLRPGLKILAVWLYWLWSDQSVAITRSALMVSEVLVLEALEVGVPFWRLLLMQFLISLIVLPRLCESLSFQLTYGCIFGILLLPRLVWRFRPLGGPLAGVWDYFWTSTGAVVGMLPSAWCAFGEVNFTSILTNWLFVPGVCFFILPLELLQMLAAVPLPRSIGLNTTFAAAAHCLALWNAWCAFALGRTLTLCLQLIPQLRL